MEIAHKNTNGGGGGGVIVVVPQQYVKDSCQAVLHTDNVQRGGETLMSNQ